MDNNHSIRHYSVIHFNNLLAGDEEKILQMALNFDIVPLKKSNTCYKYTFQAFSKVQLQSFEAKLKKSGFIFSSKQFSK